MQRLLLIVTIIVAVTAAWLLLEPPVPDPAQDAAATATDPQRQQARSHIDQITANADQPIDIGQADNFVNADQLLLLPESQVLSHGVTLAPEPASGRTGDAVATAHAVDINAVDINAGQPRSANTSAAQMQSIARGTLPQLAGQITLQELLNNPEQASGKIFYIHAVKESDKEGLWGILNSGLINSFAQGLELPKVGGRISVDIPKDADERLHDQSSSFLGHVLNMKVRETYIYNYQQGLLGDNPDLIRPGQQLIVVTFTEDELVDIYNHFVSLRAR